MQTLAPVADPEVDADAASPSPNQATVTAWNTVLFDKFVRFRHLVVEGLSRHSDAALRRAGYRAGERVLDVGCGFGDCTQRIAWQVTPGGYAIGIDCAPNFIEVARRDAAIAGLGQARFRIGDVQVDPLGGPYEHAFSRFGTMFFEQPGVAMRRIRAALRPGGSFMQVVWRRREDNPWLHVAERSVRALVPAVAHEDTDQVHCGPGPFSLAEPARVDALLTDAGFVDVRLERHDCDICIGGDLDEAVAFALALGPAGEILRLADGMGEQRHADVVAALRQALRPFVRADGVWAGSSAWLVRAVNPH